MTLPVIWKIQTSFAAPERTTSSGIVTVVRLLGVAQRQRGAIPVHVPASHTRP